MKIGIFGGSFDPVHRGHIELAERALLCGAADSVVFVPAAIQPFKQDKHPADGNDRINMIKLAAQGIKGIEVSDYELARPKAVSYTINTLNAMRNAYGAENDVRFIVGADSFLKIHTWTKADELLENYTIIVGVRPGYLESEVAKQEKILRERYGASVIMLENRPIDISSTEIRKAAACGFSEEKGAHQAVVYAIPEKVRDYIIENGLYN